MDYKYLSVPGLLLFMVLFTSCRADGGLSAEKPISKKINTPRKHTFTAQPTETTAIVVVGQTPTAGQPTPEEAAEQPTDKPTPTIKSGLQATDPSTVQIASGEIPLVEFFAFW